MLVHEKKRCLSDVKNEEELRVELLIPLLKKMGHFSDVLDNQGPDEAGVDVIGCSSSPFRKPEFTAFVLKHGNITLKASDRLNNVVMVVETQLRQAIAQPLSHPKISHLNAHANRVIVVTNGTISRTAQMALARTYSNRPDISLDFIGQDELIGQIDEYWPQFYLDRRPFLSTYASRLYESLNVVNLEQLGYTQKQRHLNEIYIDAVLSKHDVSSAGDDFSIDEELIPGNALCGQGCDLVVVTSGPGGGKSTLLKELTIKHSRHADKSAAVFLHARDVLSSDSARRAATKALQRFAEGLSGEVSSEIANHNLHLFVDGLDELATVADRETVVERLLEAHRTEKAKIVLATRPESNPKTLAALSPFTAFRIHPLRIGQIRNFFGKWFGSDASKAEKLIRALRDKGIIDKLPRTPMTMTLVAMVYETKDDVPASLTELYQMFMELLTGKWDSNRKIASTYDSAIKMAFLRRLAWIMQSERLDSVSDARVIEIADSFFKKSASVSGVDPTDFIQALIDRSHIIVPTGDGQLRFSHMTFQEYFCAEHLSAESTTKEMVTAWFGDDWWSEVLFFFAGKKQNIARYVDVLLASGFDDRESRMTKLTTLGSMLQSGFLTDFDAKERGVAFAAEKFHLCYDDVYDVLEQNAPEKTKRQLSRVLLIEFIRHLFVSNFSSTYLQEPMISAWEKVSGSDEAISAKFFLASALKALGQPEYLLELATDPKMTDPSIMLIAQSESSSFEKTPDSNRAVALKRFKRRLAKFRRLFKGEIDSAFAQRKRSFRSDARIGPSK